MIADDTTAIRDAMKKLAQAKVQAQAEADRRASADNKPADLPPHPSLFSESCPPFRGFFLSDAGDVCPWDNVTLDDVIQRHTDFAAGE